MSKLFDAISWCPYTAITEVSALLYSMYSFSSCLNVYNLTTTLPCKADGFYLITFESLSDNSSFYFLAFFIFACLFEHERPFYEDASGGCTDLHSLNYFVMKLVLLLCVDAQLISWFSWLPSFPIKGLLNFYSPSAQTGLLIIL